MENGDKVAFDRSEYFEDTTQNWFNICEFIFSTLI